MSKKAQAGNWGWSGFCLGGCSGVWRGRKSRGRSRRGLVGGRGLVVCGFSLGGGVDDQAEHSGIREEESRQLIIERELDGGVASPFALISLFEVLLLQIDSKFFEADKKCGFEIVKDSQQVWAHQHDGARELYFFVAGMGADACLEVLGLPDVASVVAQQQIDAWCGPFVTKRIEHGFASFGVVVADDDLAVGALICKRCEKSWVVVGKQKCCGVSGHEWMSLCTKVRADADFSVVRGRRAGCAATFQELSAGGSRRGAGPLRLNPLLPNTKKPRSETGRLLRGEKNLSASRKTVSLGP